MRKKRTPEEKARSERLRQLLVERIEERKVMERARDQHRAQRREAS